MNPSESGVFFEVVAGVKYGAMLRVVSLLVVPSILPLGVADCPCNPNPPKITKPTASNNVLCLMFIVDLYSVYDCCY
jgi:fumarate reductase subunit D